MIDTLLSAFLFGHIGFWIVIAILSITYTIATEQDTHAFAILVTLLGALLLSKSIWLAMVNWQLTLIVILLYGFIGAIWSVWRWFKFCRREIAVGPKQKEEYYLERLSPSRHKSQLISWIVYWPWSAFWNIAGDFFTSIYDALTNIYTRTAQYAVKRAMGSRVP